METPAYLQQSKTGINVRMGEVNDTVKFSNPMGMAPDSMKFSRARAKVVVFRPSDSTSTVVPFEHSCARGGCADKVHVRILQRVLTYRPSDRPMGGKPMICVAETDASDNAQLIWLLKENCEDKGLHFVVSDPPT